MAEHVTEISSDVPTSVLKQGARRIDPRKHPLALEAVEQELEKREAEAWGKAA